MRMLSVPDDGSPPVIVPVSLTFVDALARLEADWEKQVALKEKIEKQIVAPEP